MKVDLDKFYTPVSVAKKCIDFIPNLDTYDCIIEPSAGEGSFSSQIANCFEYDIFPENENIKQDVINIIKDISLRQMTNIKYNWYGLEYYPYDNDSSRDEIEKINNVLFRDVQKVITLSELVNELDEELDEIFNLDYAS